VVTCLPGRHHLGSRPERMAVHLLYRLQTTGSARGARAGSMLITVVELWVESRTGAVALLRFPSPLIKPDVRISRIRLSDWFHRVHTARSPTSAFHAPTRLDSAIQSARKVLGFMRCLIGFRQVTSPHRLQQTHQKSGTFPPPALPGFSGTMSLSDSRPVRRHQRR
jgi:hypothetical protein